MASSSRDKRGNAIVQFIGADKKRHSIRVGKISDAKVEVIRERVETIRAAQQHGHAIDAEVIAWFAKMSDELHGKLAATGLVPPRRSATLGKFIEEYIAGRADVKPKTLVNLGVAGRQLTKFFTPEKQMRDIGEGDARRFFIAIKSTLSIATASRAVIYARQFWHAAKKDKIVTENPFLCIKPGSMVNAERSAFISVEDAQKVIAACPDREWRLIVALARFGGLRCPSELNVLTWDDIDWDANRITIKAPKTGTRIIPLFPELRPPLTECFEAAADGAVHVMAKYLTNINLRTRFRKIIARAGLVPWDRLFHNLRASRQTELEDQFPGHVVCSWMGNSESTARKHYLRVRDEHFELAAVTSAAKSGAVNHFPGCSDEQQQAVDTQKPKEMAMSATGEMVDSVGNGGLQSWQEENFSPDSHGLSTNGGDALQIPVQSEDELRKLHVRTHLQGDVE